MKKASFVLALLATLALPLAVFANGQSESAKSGPVTLTYILKNTASTAPYKAIFQKYKEKTGNTVEIQALPTSNDYDQLMLTRFATNNYPDAFDADPGTKQYTKFRAAKTLYDFTNDPIISKLTASTKQFQTLDGKIYGIPWGSTGNLGIYYNKKVFQAMGVSVPQTYQEFLQVCAKAKSAGYVPVYAAAKTGWPLQIFSLAGWTTYVDPAIGKSGVQALDTNKLRLNNIPSLKMVLTRQLELKEKGYNQKDVLAGTYAQQQELFGTGKVAMVFQGAWFLDALAKKFGNDFVQNEVGWFPLPGNSGPGIATLYPAGQILVPRLTKHVKQTVNLVHFMTDTASLDSWYKAQPGVPVYKGVQSKLFSAQQTVVKFVDNGKAAINIQNRLGSTFTDYAKILQNLLITGNVDQALNQLDANYRQTGKARALPGF